MSVLVLKKWSVDARQPVDSSGNFMVVSGRQSGLISWLLSLCGVEPVTTLKVSAGWIDLKVSSLSGVVRRVIPVRSICSVDYGYHKPWLKAVALFVVGMALMTGLSNAAFHLDAMVLLGGAAVLLTLVVLDYVFNKTIYFRFVENSGLGSSIRFKRSVIENVAVDERQAAEACEVLLSLIEQVRQDENLIAIRYGVEGLASKIADASDVAAEHKNAAPPEPERPAQIDVDLGKIEFSCPECGKFFEGSPTLVGTTYVCPECKVGFHIH